MNPLIELIRTVWDYLGQMAVLAVPAAVAFLCITPYRCRSLTAIGLRSGLTREVGMILFVMTVFSILAVTLRPPMGWGSPLPSRNGDPWDNLSLIPFRMFQTYKAYYGWGKYIYIIINFLGNMLVFLPLGFFPALLFRRERWWRSVLVGGGISVFVEFGQYFLMRQSDIDDVILNTIGALCGFWVFLLLKRFIPGLVSKFRCQTIS